jgi:hypothetical protein
MEQEGPCRTDMREAECCTDVTNSMVGDTACLGSECHCSDGAKAIGGLGRVVYGMGANGAAHRARLGPVMAVSPLTREEWRLIVGFK